MLGVLIVSTSEALLMSTHNILFHQVIIKKKEDTDIPLSIAMILVAADL